MKPLPSIANGAECKAMLVIVLFLYSNDLNVQIVSQETKN
jgi:hypothetical protein